MAVAPAGTLIVPLSNGEASYLIQLVGILWGGSGPSFVYSPLANVVRELGALVTH